MKAQPPTMLDLDQSAARGTIRMRRSPRFPA
jgi:hypothetical protein